MNIKYLFLPKKNSELYVDKNFLSNLKIPRSNLI